MDNYKKTRLGCYLSLSMQAYCACCLPILFVSLINLYQLTYTDLGIMIFLLYSVQIIVDILVSPLLTKFGYKLFCLLTPLVLIFGVLIFVLSPVLIPSNVKILFFVGISIISMAAGLIEVLVSPLIEALPSKNKEKSMSLLHSFYGVGVIFVVSVTSLLVTLLDETFWQLIMVSFLFIPIVVFIIFLKANFVEVNKEQKKKDHLYYLKDYHFYFFLLAIMFGAAMEIIMSQWLSTFFVKTLHISKLIGDMLGVLSFAITFTIGRLGYSYLDQKYELNNLLIIGSLLSLISYLTLVFVDNIYIVILACLLCGIGVSLMWPGTLSVGAKYFHNPSPSYFGMMSAFGDLGAALFPYLIGLIVDLYFANNGFGLKFAFVVGSIISFFTVLIQIYLKRITKSHRN